MAAAGDPLPAERSAFVARWAARLADGTTKVQAILWRDQVAGYVGSFVRLGQREVTYWLGPKYWGKGIATAALAELLARERRRPIYARVAKDNRGPLRVLEKCGFFVCGADRMYSASRGQEVDEWLLILTTHAQPDG
jgi:RimJ/RimL family protein N-acetyltransferase